MGQDNPRSYSDEFEMHAALAAHRQQLLFQATIQANLASSRQNPNSELTRKQCRSLANFAATYRANMDQFPNPRYGPNSSPDNQVQSSYL
jgi:hypothetical protein